MVSIACIINVNLCLSFRSACLDMFNINLFSQKILTAVILGEFGD